MEQDTFSSKNTAIATWEKAPVCCKDGWQLVFAGSRFTQNGQPNYVPTEKELLAAAWGLGHAKFFVLGCDKLTVSTDHRPLLGILNDRDLSTISNSSQS